MLVKQLKHLDHAKNLATVPFLYVKNWFNVILNLSKIYDIFGMFITNKKITGLPDSNWPDNLIVVHADK